MKDILKHYIIEEILGNRLEGELSEEEDLLGSGLVDSLGMMRLVGFIEEKFGVAVPPEDVTIESFSTITAICDYLDSRKTSHG